MGAKKRQLPSYLHELFGEEQSLRAIAAIVAAGLLIASALFIRFPGITEGVPLWRGTAAFLLVFDIAAGCLANFTASTNAYYRARPRLRLIFIAVHIHLPLVAALLGIHLWEAVLVWLATVIGALAVNAMRSRRQLPAAGAMLAFACAWVPMLPDIEPFMLAVSLLFMLKVVFSFGVDHERGRAMEEEYGNRAGG